MNNRIIKFRVWDKLAQHMIYPDKGYQQHYILDLNGRFHNLQNGSGGDDYVVLEYTGLTDSNDKEICEGDIIEYNYGNGYGNGSRIGYVDFFAGIYHLYNLDKTADDVLGQWLKNELKVIGNIFETPYLLK